MMIPMHTVQKSIARNVAFVVIASIGAYPGQRAFAQCDAVQAIKLSASDRFTGDWFGSSRAVAISGDRIAVGAVFNDDAGTSSGAAYVFVRTAGVWTEEAKLLAADAAIDDRFGVSVGISGDTVVVGAEMEDDADTNAGAAYVFVRSGSTWTQQAKLVGTGLDNGAMFGHAVAISGNTIAVTAPLYNAVLANEGAIFIFVRSGTTWSQQAVLSGADLDGGERLGMSVALDGDTVIGGSTFDNPFGPFSGSAYVFVRGGVSWAQQGKLIPSDGATMDIFGEAVALHGNRALVGAPQDDDAGSSSGSAYVFTRSGTVWSQQAKLTASDAASGDGFGLAVGIRDNLALIGAYVDDIPFPGGINAGSAYLFQTDGMSWWQRDKMSAADANSNDQYGQGVALDGDTGVITAPYDDLPGTDAGAAYVVDLVPTLSCDIDGDADVDATDLTIFINVLLGIDTTPARRTRSDLDCSGVPNGADIPYFLDCYFP